MVRQEINPDIALPPVESEYAVVFEPVEERWLYNVSYRFFDPASGERLGVVPGRIEVTDLGDGFALETTLEDAGQFGPWIEQLLPERESVVAAGQTSSEPPILIPFPQEAVSIGSRWNAGVLGEAWLIGIDTFRGEFGLLVETISVDGSETATLLIDPATGVVLRAKYEGTVSEGDNRYPYEFRMERQPGSGSR
jgi:hypothetical protein